MIKLWPQATKNFLLSEDDLVCIKAERRRQQQMEGDRKRQKGIFMSCWEKMKRIEEKEEPRERQKETAAAGESKQSDSVHEEQTAFYLTHTFMTFMRFA